MGILLMRPPRSGSRRREKPLGDKTAGADGTKTPPPADGTRRTASATTMEPAPQLFMTFTAAWPLGEKCLPEASRNHSDPRVRWFTENSSSPASDTTITGVLSDRFSPATYQISTS